MAYSNGESAPSMQRVATDNSQAAPDGVITRISSIGSLLHGVSWLDDDGWHRTLMLTQHFITLTAEIVAVAVFWASGNYMAFTLTVLTLLLSGCFCWYVAWSCREPARCHWACLPFNKTTGLRRCCCFFPMFIVCGLLQGILVPLTLTEPTERFGSNSGARDNPTRWHCKAYVGIFENIVISGVVFYEYLGDHLIPGSAAVSPTFEGPFARFEVLVTLRVIWVVILTSAGISIMELDFCLCRASDRWAAVQPNRYKKRFNHVLHFLYRSSEIVFRMSTHVCFIMLTVKQLGPLSLAPLLVSVLTSVSLVYVHGGYEVTFLVRLLCAIPYVFVDIFRFIDSPYKRTAARRLSKWFLWRTVVETLALGYLLVATLGKDGLWDGMATMYKYSPASMTFIGICWSVFFILRVPGFYQLHVDRQNSIFESCETCNSNAVRELFKEAAQLDVNSMDVEGQTPLVLALVSGKRDDQIAEVCKLLVENGAKVEQLPGEDRLWWRKLFVKYKRLKWTPLHIAAHKGAKSIMEELITAVPECIQNERAWYRDEQGDTPLHVAVKEGRLDVIDLLACRRPDWLEKRNQDGHTPEGLTEPGTRVRSELTRPLITEPNDREISRWQSRPIRVQHTQIVPKAPGICSFVAAIAGGPFSTTFLQPIPENEEVNVESDEELGSEMIPSIKDLVPVSSDEKECASWLKYQSQPKVSDVSAFTDGLAEYAREAFIGKGQYGVVWRARCRNTGEVVAVKNMQWSQRDNRGAIVKRECDMADWVKNNPHPCIVRLITVLQLYTQSGVLSMLPMELCPNGDLGKAILAAHRQSDEARSSYLAPDKAQSWIAQIFLGLEHMHKKEMLLRDLKPDNVVISRGHRAKLTDFGLGRFGLVSVGKWTFDFPPGTPGYVAPEVLKQKKHGPKADLYSFGVVCWMLLTGGIRILQKERADVFVEDVYPPTMKFMTEGSYKALQEDDSMLRNLIKKENPNDTAYAKEWKRWKRGAQWIPGGLKLDDKTKLFFPQAVQDPAKELILGLLQRAADKRFEHGKVRGSAFFTRLRPSLPSGNVDEVERWLIESNFIE